MANFLHTTGIVYPMKKLAVTLFGGGPPPLNEPLDVVADPANLVDVARKGSRSGPYYDWEVTGKAPGQVTLNAVLRGTRQPYAAPMVVTVAGRIKIKLRYNGEGELECVGLGSFKVLGQSGRRYPKDLTIDPTNDPSVKKRLHRSSEFNVNMPFAIRIWGQVGIFIHEFPDNLRDNGGPSAGCIHVGRINAERVFNYIVTRTRITIDYPW